MSGQNNSPKEQELKRIVIEMAVDNWRCSKLLLRVLSKLDAGEAGRYISQLKFFTDRLDENLKEAGVRLVNVEGHIYDPGMAVKPLNMDDFSTSDSLLVEQMIEPIIMSDEGLVKSGTVMLARGQK